MPRFYFHLYNDVEVPDQQGHEFPDLKAAYADALRQARALAGQTAKDTGRIVLSHRIDIEDAHQTVLGTVSMRDAIRVEN